MRRAIFGASLLALALFGSAIPSCARAADPLKFEQMMEGHEPVAINISDRDRPSENEWCSMCQDGQRSGMLGNVVDFKSRSVAFMNTRYFTANSFEGTLASYGKMGPDKRYDRFGQIEGVEFAIDQNSWKQHYVLNAAALVKLTGSRFIEYLAGTLEAAVDKNKQIEVTFIGTTVPKDEAIRRINSNIEALEYIDTLAQKKAAFDRNKSLLKLSAAPPAPKVVLANVVMVNGTFANALDLSADGKLHSRVLSDGVELSVTCKNGEQVTLQSPVVRCYRTYSVEFKTDASGQPVRRIIADKDGNPHQVPQVFDLTPDI